MESYNIYNIIEEVWADSDITIFDPLKVRLGDLKFKKY